ncbi:MAG TPA: sortase, partial [Streptosporangiaceae bacterium]|nr:sortase [Streptosporangiaceae bacterium]
MPRLRMPGRLGRGGWVTGRMVATAAGVVLIAGGGSVLGVAAAAQQHAPQPGPDQAGVIAAPARTPAPRSTTARGTTARPSPTLARSLPVSISIPAIGVRSRLLHVGLNPNGTIQVPPLNDLPATNEAAWYKYSPTPGQLGPSIIEGHVDSARYGPSVFFRLGALKPGNQVDVTLADHQVAVFKVTAVRMYPKSHFPTSTVYGNT